MSPGELHRLGEILVTGMAELGAAKWPSVTRAFALAVDDTKATNKLAASFYVIHGSTGRYCHDYRNVQAMLHQATLISYDSVDHERFNVRITKRSVAAIYRRIQATDQEKADAQALLLAHWDRAYGRPWKADP